MRRACRIVCLLRISAVNISGPSPESVREEYVPKAGDYRTLAVARMVRGKDDQGLLFNSLATINSVGEPQLCEKL
jgi:hypothetical protein